MSILSLLHSVVHATTLSWIKWVFNVAAHFTVLRPGPRQLCRLFHRSITVPPQDAAVKFPLDYESAVAESGPITHYNFLFKYFCGTGPKSGPIIHYNFYFKYFCGMQNKQRMENKFLTPYRAPNDRIVPLDHKAVP
jgi:hypothetical protein